MLTNPNTCGLFEREIVEIAEVGARGRRLLLLRRRQLQRHRRQGAPRRPRRRRHAHQPAQDLLDAARRRRAGRRSGGAVGGARPVRAAALRRARTATSYRLVEDMRRCRRWHQPFGRITAFHGQMGMFVRALTYMLSHGADGMRQASEDAVLIGQLHPRQPQGPDEPAVRRPGAVHARGAVRRRLAQGYRRHHARLRQGDDRRGLPPDDHVLPAGRPWRHADRADRSRNRSRASTSSSAPCGSSRTKPSTATTRAASSRRRCSPRAAASTRPRPPASRGCGGGHPRTAKQQPSRCAGRGEAAPRSATRTIRRRASRKADGAMCASRRFYGVGDAWAVNEAFTTPCDRLTDCSNDSSRVGARNAHGWRLSVRSGPPGSAASTER